MNYVFHPAAEAELLESVGYYESRVPGLGDALINEFEALISLLFEQPRARPIALDPDVRIAPLQRFPLSIIYRMREETLEIIAMAHDRRRPNYWLERVQSDP